MPKLFEAPFYTAENLDVMDEQELIFPYSDIYMKYDSIKRKYIPTEELLIKHGIDIGAFLASTGENTPQNVNNELEYISDQIYTYCDKNSGSNIDTLKWIIAKGMKLGMKPYRFRLLFQEILWKQARFYVNNDDPSKSIGLDIEQKQYLGKGVLYNEDRHIDPKVKVLLMDLGLVWTGSYDRQFRGYVLGDDW